MRIKLLKYSRIFISLLFLILTGFLFLDFAGTFSTALINGITWIQFVPSLIKFLNLAGFLTLGFLVVIVVTVLFGRIYCSTACPLGILQDVVSRVSRFYKVKIRGKTKRYRPAPAQNLLRYSLLGLTVTFFLFGSVFFLILLDPFSLFGKIISGLARPLYFEMNNLAADFLIARRDYTLYHVETRQLNYLPLAYPALILGLVTWLSFTKGRLYCNTVCPVGSFLGLISKYSMYRIEIDQTICNSCNKCSLNCKAQCIDIKNNEIDFTRCVGCFNCLNICSEHGIDYRNQWFNGRSDDSGTTNIKKKKLRKIATYFPTDGSAVDDLDKVIESLTDSDTGSNTSETGSDTGSNTSESGPNASATDPKASESSPKASATNPKAYDITTKADTPASIKTINAGRRGFLFSVLAYLIGISAASRIVRAGGRLDEMPGGRLSAQSSGSSNKYNSGLADNLADGQTYVQEPDIRDDLDVIVTKPSTIPEDKQFPISPPGSFGLDHFTGACTACQLCVSVCPTRVLQPSFLEYGFTGMMQPKMDFHASFCNFDCTICTEICPTGAIFPLSMEKKHVAQIGVVTLELDNCVVQTENTACGACAEHCPTQAVRMVPYQDGLTIPEIVVDHCVGCGACEYICPTRPYRAIYVDGNPEHKKAIPPVIEELDYVPDDDFPF